MNLSSMTYFLALARTRSFTRAASELHITQQSLSAHVASLEKELGCLLIVRRAPLELTYAGEVFLDYAARFDRQMTALRQEFCDIAGNQRGILRLGIAFTRGRAILPSLIGAFQTRFPHIDIRLTEDTNDALHRSLLQGDIDLAIANFPDTLSGICLRDYYREEVVLLLSDALVRRVCGAEGEEVLARLEHGDFGPLQRFPFVLGNERDIAGRLGRELFRKHGLAPAVKVTSGNMETLLALCAEGIGACFCPENLARVSLRGRELSALHTIRLGEAARYTIRFGFLEGTYQWSILSAFMETALQQL